MSEDKSMLIVLASDDRYALPLAVTAHSALTRISKDFPVSLMIVDAGMSEESRQKMRGYGLVPDFRTAETGMSTRCEKLCRALIS